ncbi:NAD(P)-binding protein [Ascobolus immersus RN42]|uniref:NAD(P)-binding protein n=1 Tax=Ascobolus immersus RN42 TaxID=1160509 RepID=A0A3N4HQ96_ASCIM|nr:NAD(P)-binding protein [Ascobolus immersus RN42]
MSTPAKKIITVFGATGQQGGSVARSLVQNPAFHVRGITRNPASEKAKQLEALGVEVIKANGFNAAELAAAFAGAYGAFINTNSGDPELQNGTLEVQLGRTIADAAHAAGVQHIVLSTSPSTAAIVNFPILMFDSKAEIHAYFKSLPFPIVQGIFPGWYMENHLDPAFASFGGGFPFYKDADGFFTWKMPRWGKDPIPFVAMSEDYGDIAHGLFLSPEDESLKGKTVHGFSDELHYDEWVKVVSEATGKKTRYVEIPHEELATYGVKELEELAALFKFCDLMDGQYFGEKADVETPRKLKALVQQTLGREETGLASWKGFVEKHKEELSKVLEPKF